MQYNTTQQQLQHKAYFPRVPSLRHLLCAFMLAAARAANESGAARRRQRRLRQWLRHERLSVAMALAESQHHTAPRGLRMARARGEESVMNTATGQKTPLLRAASTVHFDLFDEGDVLAARPTPLVEVRPQTGVQRHTAEQIIETFVPVQILDAPVPQMGGEQVVEFMQQFDVLAGAEPVIEVPKISQDMPRRRRMGRRRRRNSWWKCRRSSRSLRCCGLSSRTLMFQFLRFGGEEAEVFMVFALDRALQQRTWSRSLVFQFLSVVGGEVEVFKVLSLDTVQQRIWSGLLLHVEVLKVFSRTGFFLIESISWWCR